MKRKIYNGDKAYYCDICRNGLVKKEKALEHELLDEILSKEEQRFLKAKDKLLKQVKEPEAYRRAIQIAETRATYYGSIPEFIRQENISDGIIWSCEKYGVPYVLAGSIRDDGPLPPVYGNVYEAQDAMRDQIRSATTVICMATVLHTIATGNMTPSFRVMPDGTVRQVYFYCVDISEFAVNKLADRGSLSAKGIVTNVQDFVVNLSKGLGLS